MTLAQFHPAPPPPDSPASLFSAWDYLPCCLYINPFLLSFTCYLEARNSSAAERLRPGQSFPGHQPYLLCSALLEASCAWGREGKGVCWEGMSLCLYKVAAGRCVDVCVCVREELRRIRWRPVAQWYPGAEEARCLPSLPLPVLEGDADRGWAATGTEQGWMPGSQGTLLFGQQDPRGLSIARVTMSIKRQTWPAVLLRRCLPPRVLY